jgi:hypothetical protein
MPKKRGTCGEPGCGQPHYAKGLCLKHYRQSTRGTLGAGNPRRVLPEGAETKFVGTKVTAEQFKLLQAAAKRRGMSVYKLMNMFLGEFVRLDAAGETRPPEAPAPKPVKKKRTR